MADLQDISVGNYTKVFYDDGTAWAELEKIQTVTLPTVETTEVTQNHYGELYAEKRGGSRTVGSAEVVVSWNPSLDSHTEMEAIYETGAVTRFYFEFTDPTGTDSTFQPFSATVLTNSLASDFDVLRAKTFSLSVSGALGAYSETAPTYG